MAVSIAGSEFDDEGDFAETHEINVTPFIDVMLVLLIIFMVAAPLATVDLPVDLPTSSAVSQKKPDKPTYLTIKADLSLAIGETPVKRAELIQALDGMPGINPETARERPIFMRGDRSVPYGEVSFAYGGAGGGSTLGDLGALPAGYLSAGQARIALATALATGVNPHSLL